MDSKKWYLVKLSILAMLAQIQCQTVDDLNIVQHRGNYSQPMEFTFDFKTEHVLVFPTSQSVYPYRIKAWTINATTYYPVMVVVRQEREVLSWQVPFMVDTSKRDEKLQFRNTSRTLCHNNMKEITNTKKNNFYSKVFIKDLSQNFIVALSTSSPRFVNIVVEVEEERDFYVETDKKYYMSVSPSETRYVYYKFPDNKTDVVVIDVNSDDDVCLTVSVQDSYCPVFDLDKDITYEGTYQTVNRKGALSIRRKQYPAGFFLVFVAKGDNYECSQENSVLPNPRNVLVTMQNRTSLISFVVSKSINSSDYITASMTTLGVIGGFYVVSLLMAWAFSRWGSISKIKAKKSQDIVDAELLDDTHPLSRVEIERYLENKELTVKNLAKYPLKDKRRSFNYLWHILSIAIFYSIPVVQLVITYQRVVNQTGNEDLCYYNFLCAHPAFGLSDFNHIFSNIGYIFIGLLFLIVILHRHSQIPVRFETGIPVHYGLFYAMGVALIIEGLLSACYHICPSQSNYQFDTSFMYVMAVLCMVKLYQNRHPDINATAYATFTVLGLAIFLAMIGILNGSLAVWIVFVVMYSILCVYISFKIYFLSFIIDGFKKFKDDITENGWTREVLAPIKRSRFIVLVAANIINYAMLITGLCLYDNGITDFGTFLLGLLMGNAVLHTVFYTVMKMINGERICMEAIVYGLLMIASWAASAVFFLDNATLWTVTPAESRQWNQDCIFMNFYDKHDVWHLLSAPALYFSFMYLLCLDDDVIDKNQDEIPVF